MMPESCSKTEDTRNALNRAYYSVFRGMRAVNALDGFDSSKHSGVISNFNQQHVKTGDFPKRASAIIRQASEKREYADYLDFFIASKEDAEEQIRNAEEFAGMIKNYLENKQILQSSK